jgi:hypothetical protein
MTGINPEQTDEGLRAALAFFIAVEHVPMDVAHNDIADALVEEFGPDEILRGLALVAALLRKLAPRACQRLRLRQRSVARG